MKQRARTWPWLLLLAMVPVAAWLVLQPAPTDSRHEAYEVAQARLRAVERASATTLPTAQLLAVGHPSSAHGDLSVSGKSITYVSLYRRRHDLAQVPMEDAHGGPVQALLDLAERQAAVLAEAGFEPMTGEWSTTGNEGRMPIADPEETLPGIATPPSPGPSKRRRPIIQVADRHQSDSGGGGGRSRVDLNAAGIIHYRMYVVPLSGATLFVRNHFDDGTTVVASEFAYTDRTLVGVTYPHGSYIQGRRPGHFRLREWIVQRD